MIFEEKDFNNLSEFMGYLDKCPLCGRRNDLEILPFMDGKINGSLIYIKDERVSPTEEFSIDIFSNKIDGHIRDAFLDANDILARSICGRYHFFYEATCDLSKNKDELQNIRLQRYHFIRIFKDATHFSVKSTFPDNLTSVRITKDFQTRIINLPLVNFNFSSEKKIDKKLKHIQLLG